MTREESKVLFDEIREYLNEKGFTTAQSKEGEYSKHNYKGDYMLFNCPHVCSSVRLFKVKQDGKSILNFVKDIRTSYALSLDTNRENVFNFLNEVTKEYDL